MSLRYHAVVSSGSAGYVRPRRCGPSIRARRGSSRPSKHKLERVGLVFALKPPRGTTCVFILSAAAAARGGGAAPLVDNGVLPGVVSARERDRVKDKRRQDLAKEVVGLLRHVVAGVPDRNRSRVCQAGLLQGRQQQRMEAVQDPADRWAQGEGRGGIRKLPVLELLPCLALFPAKVSPSGSLSAPPPPPCSRQRTRQSYPPFPPKNIPRESPKAPFPFLSGGRGPRRKNCKGIQDNTKALQCPI